jgi:hypothetical protein
MLVLIILESDLTLSDRTQELSAKNRSLRADSPAARSPFLSHSHRLKYIVVVVVFVGSYLWKF